MARPGPANTTSSNSAATECNECGAPRTPGLIACSYCETAYPGLDATSATACPRCGDKNLPSNTACSTCGTSLAVTCVFCGGTSPLSRPSCVRCGEAFAGALERKRARDAQQQQQQMIGIATQGIGALGMVLSEVVHHAGGGGGHTHGHHQHGHNHGNAYGGGGDKYSKGGAAQSAGESGGGLLGALGELFEEATKKTD